LPEIAIRLADEGISYSVHGADRDWVLNTQVDLTDRLGSVAISTPIMPFALGGVLGLLFMASVYTEFARRLRNRFDARRRALDANAKKTRLTHYMFRINDPALPTFTPIFALQFAMVIGGFIGFGSYYAAKLLYPKNVFLIGAEIDRYAHLVSIRQYLLTGVAVSLIVGIVASIIANLATRDRS
jgi:hypothetical protein